MQIHKSLKNPLIFGTLLLTGTGILGKIIGFFYKIFLSRTIGAEGIGIYQLIFPICSICFAITSAGISTALSKYVAEYQQKDPCASKKLLHAGLFASGFLSFAIFGILYRFSDFIAEYILLEKRCTPFIRILALSIPLASIHSCIHGYYYGKKKAVIPAFSSLIEQSARVFFVFLAYQIRLEQNLEMDVSLAVWGLVVGESAAFLFCLTAIFLEKKECFSVTNPLKHPALKLITYAIPLTANRLTLTLFSSFESILIPSRLHLFGYNVTDALSVYGVLTGMAFSIVMFPTVFSNAVSVMILPMISEAASRQDNKKINHTVSATICVCLFLGIICTLGYFIFGQWMGDFLFQNALAGKFITMLSFICPFLFLSSILTSILNGLGKAGYTFLLNVFGCFIRIIFVFFFIPTYGIRAYLIGFLFSEIVTATLSVLTLKKNNKAA